MTTKHKPTPKPMPPNAQHLSLNDEAFIHLAAVVLDQPEESIIKSLLKLRSENKQRTRKRKHRT